MTLNEINEATTLIQKEAHEDANIIWGMVIDETMTEEIRVTVIATGFGKAEEKTFRPRVAIPGSREWLLSRSFRNARESSQRLKRKKTETFLLSSEGQGNRAVR